MEIGITVDLSSEFQEDVISIAIEGGINFWGTPKRKQAHTLIYTVTPTEDPDDFPPFDLSRITVVDGVRRILNAREPRPVREDIQATILQAVLNDDASFIDAECADCIVQMGQFGEIVYG